MFGEYVLMFGSWALSIPYNRKYGRLTFHPGTKNNTVFYFSGEYLNKYFSHLKQLAASNELKCKLRLDELERDIVQGLAFESTLPISYGLGSSGALVAALYHHYAENPIPVHGNLTTTELLTLKQQFSQLESYFHGTSSGLDPLVSYLQDAILIEGKDKLKAVSLPEEKDRSKAAVFLLDSGVTGKTQPLVRWFMDKCREDSFCNKVKNEFIPLNNSCIRAFLSGDTGDLLPQVRELSRFTLSHFQPMVPEQLTDAWEKGLSSGDFYLKLCGSGGGGMMLGFTEDMDKARQMLEGFDLTVVRKL